MRQRRWRVVVAFVVLVGVSWLLRAPAGADTLNELLAELRIIPLPDQTPTPFTLESLGGGTVALGDLRGRAVMLYFWEST